MTWTQEELRLKAEIERGRAAAVNLKSMKNLCQWAQEQGLFLYVGRGWGSIWGNPFEIGRDGNRDEVCDAWEKTWESRKHLHSKVEQLRGKALACYCHPERCHAHHLATIANNEAEKRTPLS